MTSARERMIVGVTGTLTDLQAPASGRRLARVSTSRAV